MINNGFGFDSMEDLIEADIQYGLFTDDDKLLEQQNQSKKQFKERKSFWNVFKV